MKQPRVQLDAVSKHYGEGATRVEALRGVSLQVTAGRVFGLIGPSGSGKSTLLNIIGCIVEPSAGVVHMDGEPIWDLRRRRSDLRALRLEKIGFIFQQHNLLPFLTASENVEVVVRLAGGTAAEARQRARELLTYLQVDERPDALPSQLSGGQAQRVAIARALANRPSIILADEPTAALDSERAGAVMDLFQNVARQDDAAVLVVTHDEKVFGRFDDMVTLRDGRIVQLGQEPSSTSTSVRV